MLADIIGKGKKDMFKHRVGINLHIADIEPPGQV